MKALWIALLAVGISLFTTFIAIYAAQVKKTRDSGTDAHSSTSGDSSTASDCASDGGGGGCD
jgi:mannose/fructose/N-acetylgalactosamine-specific phosphotransferase system component IIC